MRHLPHRPVQVPDDIPHAPPRRVQAPHLIPDVHLTPLGTNTGSNVQQDIAPCGNSDRTRQNLPSIWAEWPRRRLDQRRHHLESSSCWANIRGVKSEIPCASCSAACPGRGPFCGSYCKALAEFVRLCRRWLREPAKQADPQYPYALQVRLAFLHSARIGHGQVYDKQARHLTHVQKAAIRERDSGLCVKCGKPGAEIDHINGSSDDPSNLQFLCLDCHHAKTRQAMTAITDPADRAAIAALHAELAHRINSPAPCRACDNEQTWANAWRSWPAITAAGAYDPQPAPLRFADIMAVIARTSAR
jgi:hypothetical protein